ncbi:hypothetical protein [Holospora curviuscula]|uniref:Glucose-6-phosphate isomerase n=1 Tax=Holospora curviuscula TaxID=1082868 RepID=A0A2S5R8Y2_9PROT|nr:hypothetical protein [Holospora curviuscula]PPE03786.1 glucose-6-phosphate isomerase [Holospora curviuscula]
MRNNPLFRQDMRLVLDAHILDWSLFLRNHAKAAQALKALVTQKEQFSCFSYLWSRSHEFEDHSKHFREFRTILVAGRMEDLAGTQCIVDWVQSFTGKHHQSFPVVHFIVHPDPELFWEMMGTLDLKHTGVIIIGSNPNDLFPYIILLRCLESWKSTECSVQHHIMIWIPKGAELPHIHPVVQTFKLNVQYYSEITPKSSSCFNEISFSIGNMIGFHFNLFLGGAKKTCQQYFHHILKSPLEGAALYTTLKQQYPNLAHWIWNNTKNFHPLAQWIQWMWQDMLTHRYTSSFPKHIFHPPPFYLGFTTTFWEKKSITDVVFPNYFSSVDPQFTQIHLKQLLEQEFRTTCKILTKHTHAVRVFYIKQFSEEILGGLMAHFLLETTLLFLMEKEITFPNPP